MIISPSVAIESVPAIPWKNGGGITRTLAMEPEDASLGDVLWRISLAEIHESGDFSSFPGLDRTILLWRGNGVVLESSAWPDHALTAPFEPFRFRGEDAVSCRLVDGPTADLNAMVQRGAAISDICGEVEAITIAPCDDLVVLCAAGSVRISLRDRTQRTLEADCFIRIRQPNVSIGIVPAEPGSQYVCITMHRTRS